MDRFKFRVPIKCRKCGKISFRYGKLSPAFKIVEDGDESCFHCRSYCVDIIKSGGFEQCTGLSAAKSCRGTRPEDLLIYEHDKLLGKPDSDGNRCIHVVKWDDADARFCLEIDGNPEYGRMRILQEWINKTEKEIIGTIHDSEVDK